MDVSIEEKVVISEGELGFILPADKGVFEFGSV